MAGAPPDNLLQAGAGLRCSCLAMSRGENRVHEPKGPERAAWQLSSEQTFEACEHWEETQGTGSKQGRHVVLHSVA